MHTFYAMWTSISSSTVTAATLWGAMLTSPPRHKCMAAVALGYAIYLVARGGPWAHGCSVRHRFPPGLTLRLLPLYALLVTLVCAGTTKRHTLRSDRPCAVSKLAAPLIRCRDAVSASHRI